ncbi:predicted protein [Uncinocarpus reesii 1704]|uniref:Mediator of RNA polymerase II transcription subunit 17 n=1 Tax=Uncinocarpus reesii (strain UAMH 1704) TaxID=336963 RepID=C4JI48_UNCRE|nr:uncharacterized protein UREG_02794 [Uncinocarpus reesii 1704]EEP77945.1 predicted protein [Uncinocarpus reesii 1704]
MSERLTLPLRPTQQRAHREDDLAIKIAQINAQRGSFRDVTEASLLAEIEAARTAGENEDEEVDMRKSEDEEQNREEKLFRSRLEISQFAMNAHMEATYALEFISLLLSKFTPRQAETSMSPLLKQKVPLGSLAIDRTKPPEQSESQKRDISAVSRGWKLESLDAAASKLLQSAERLEEDIAAETKYWAEVLKIKQEGWKVCKLPRERQTLGVHFGSLESAPIFRDRGLAAFRKGEGERLFLDRGVQTKPPQVVRIRIREGDRTVAVSVPAAPRKDESLACQIREARDSLFEEELFYELNREARVLLQHGVEIRRNSIKFHADDTKQVHIDLVGFDEEPPDIETDSDPFDSILAHSIAMSFRILLCYAHRENYRRRTSLPPPLTPNKRPNPEYKILRPVLSYLQHRSHYRWFTSLFENITSTLQSAGLKCNYTVYPLLKPSRSHSEQTQPPIVLSYLEKFIGTLTNPMESFLRCTLVSQTSVVKMRIRTNVNPNGLGSEFDLVSNLCHFPAQQSPFRFGLREDARKLILYLFTLDLVHLVPPLGKPADTTSSLNIPIAGLAKPRYLAEEEGLEDGEFVRSPTQKPDKTCLLPWQPTFPQNGELTAYSPAHRRTKKLRIQLEDGQLHLQCSWAGRGGNSAEEKQQQPGEISFAWRAADIRDEAADASRVSFHQAVEILGKEDADQPVQDV